MRSRFLAWIGFAASSAWSFSAAAEVDGAFQLGLATDAFVTSTVELDSDTPVAGGLSVTGQSDVKRMQFGFAGDNGVTLQLGYALSEQLVLGGFLQASSVGVETDTDVGGVAVDTDEETTRLLLAPAVQFLFTTQGSARPFVLGALGYATLSDDDGTNTLDLSGFDVLGGVGLHWFLAPGASLDPMLYFSYTSVSGELDPDTGNTTDLEGSVTTIALSVGVSGWIP